MQHNMQFSDFKLLKVDFKVNPSKPGDKKPVNYNPEVLIKHQAVEDQKLLIVMIGLKVTEITMPFCFEVHGIGLFKFDEMPEPQLLEQFGRINCPAILYPYLRETVADLTRRAGFSPLHLKPINFIDLEKRRKELLEKSAISKKKAAKKKSK